MIIDKEQLLKLLKDGKIKYDLFDHPPLNTVEESIKMRGAIDGCHTKNLFLKNKKNTFFLITCLESTTVDLKTLSKRLSLGNISFAKKEHLDRKLGVLPGAVTPFGLLNNLENDVIFYLDSKIAKSQFTNFHPLINTSTINLKVSDFLNFMKVNNKLVKLVNFDTYEIFYE